MVTPIYEPLVPTMEWRELAEQAGPEGSQRVKKKGLGAEHHLAIFKAQTYSHHRHVA